MSCFVGEASAESHDNVSAFPTEAAPVSQTNESGARELSGKEFRTWFANPLSFYQDHGYPKDPSVLKMLRR